LHRFTPVRCKHFSLNALPKAFNDRAEIEPLESIMQAFAWWPYAHELQEVDDFQEVVSRQQAIHGNAEVTCMHSMNC
jgi:hypothetical protein